MNIVAQTDIVLIDLSSLAYPIWHTSQAEPDPNAASRKIADRVRQLANGRPHVAICCDSGRSFRHDIASTYKGNRPEQDGTLQHQIALACEALASDGFPVWSVRGFEADDLIASACARAIETPDLSVVIITADKDLLQLVGPRVRAMSARDGSVLDADGVGAKFGVTPGQMRDYLTLVGDDADNVKGVRGIGPKKAAEILAKHGSLDAVYEVLEQHGGARLGLPPAIVSSLKQFKASGAFEITRQLITLRTDVDIPFAALGEERQPQNPAAADLPLDALDDEPAVGDGVASPDDAPLPAVAQAGNAPQAEGAPAPLALAKREEASAPAEFELELGPRSLREARVLAQDMFASRLFSAYGNAPAILSTVMLGRELGLPAMASLRGIHIIEGRHALSAQLMVALVLKSGFAEFFEPVEFDEKKAVFETKRRGARNPVKLTHTIEMAATAGLIKPNSNWSKVPTDMLVARAQSRLCRLVYPDVVGGLYTPEELRDMRAEEAVA